jgi:hypothetical protein
VEELHLAAVAKIEAQPEVAANTKVALKLSSLSNIFITSFSKKFISWLIATDHWKRAPGRIAVADADSGSSQQ